ncbi:MAG: cytochrome c oxidase subunit 3 family protein [Planctomycetota bacterium]
MSSANSVADKPDHDAHSEFGEEWHLAHHFHTPEQQFESGKMGIWLFLGTEILFFSGLFVAYALYRFNHPDLFEFASGYLDTTMGATNTVVLIFSSLTAAWAVRCAQLNQRKGLIIALAITLACAATFMVIKYIEYKHKIHIGLFPGAWSPTEMPDGSAFDPKVAPYNLSIFFGIYFCMTGLHGIHVLIGIGLITWLLIRSFKGEFTDKYFTPVDFVALYWHIVDVIWIFLFPLLYLIQG